MSALATLSDLERNAFYNLSYVNLIPDITPGTAAHNDAVALAIFQTNAVAAGDTAGLFPTMARLNHGCAGAFNAVYNWRENEGVVVVYALKLIKMGHVRLHALSK